MKKINYIISVIIVLMFQTVLMAQVPVPANDQDNPVMLVGGVAHLGNGNVIQNAIVAFENGKLTIVADAASDQTDRSGYEVIDVSGKHIYPGFILPNTQLGLQEVSSIRAMSDNRERGTINPNVRSIVAYNTDSEIPPTLRFNGILLAETTPTGGIISGSSSVVELDGWNWEDAAHTVDVAIHLNWPSRMTRRFDFTTFTVKNEPNKDYDKQVQELEKHFTDAVSYNNLAVRPVNLKMSAMTGLFDGSKALLLHTSNPKGIVESVKFAQNHGVKRITVVTGDAAWHAREFLRQNNIAVILPATHSLPSRADADYDLPFKLPYLLSNAGVMVSLSHTGMLANSRNLPFYAGTAVAYGVDKEEALKMITSNTAKILGIDKRTGTLEAGKDATLFVSEGDAFDFDTNNLSHAFISGKAIVLDNKQQELFERYSKKYGHANKN